MLALGISRAEIGRRLGIAKATVSYHAGRLGATIDPRFARRYDWHAVQEYYDAGYSVRECIEAFGFSAASWSDAVRRGDIVARATATPIAELLVADTYRGRYNLKVRLLREGLKENRCERCGLTEWLNEPLTLALHHVNGKRNDNRLENLQLLCPNCHSQTRNFAGRNGRGQSEASATAVATPGLPLDAGADVPGAAEAGSRGELRSSSGRSQRPEALSPVPAPQPRRSSAGGRGRDRPSVRRSRPPPRGRQTGRRS